MSNKDQKSTISVLKMIANIVSWTCLVLLILVAGFLLYYIISSQIYATKGEGHAPKFSLYTIISPSMTPNIKVYDIVVDKRVDDPNELKKGDVITFISTSSISNGMTITHRIVDVIETDEGKQFKTKGDANITADYALVTPDKIIGKVRFRVPQLGRVQFLLSSKGGWILLILIPAVLIILADMLKLFNLFDIKKRVKNVETESLEEEEQSHEKMVEEYKKQQELKKQLQAKTNKTKYRKNKYEEDGFLDTTEEVIVKVKASKKSKKKNKVVKVEHIELEEQEREELFSEDVIIRDTLDEFESDNIIQTEESIKNITSVEEKEDNTAEYENIFKSIEDALAEEQESEEEVIEITDYIDNDDEKEFTSFEEDESDEIESIEENEENDSREQLDLDKLRAKLQEEDDDEVVLPKVIELREEIIPDDLDLPTSKND